MRTPGSKSAVRRRYAGAAFAALVLLVTAIAAYDLAAAALRMRGAAVGFDFLLFRSGFQISDSLFPVLANDPVWLSVLAGLVNTVRVSLMSIATALPIGIFLGMLRTAKDSAGSRLAGAIIEPIRNTPVVLQLILWYGIVTQTLPGPRGALELLPGVFLSNRGLVVPWFDESGHWQTPHLAGFNFEGGLTLSPELTVLWLGLALFHGCYIAEIFRGGFASVPRGQTDAARALALPRRVAFWRITLPQALAFAIPPIASQLLALVKNSSLAVAIGYPDFVSVLNTAVNQNGRALEGLAITIIVFFSLNAGLGALIERLNRRFGTGRVGLVSERFHVEDRSCWRAFVATPQQIAMSVAVAAISVWLAARFIDWAIVRAVWSGGAEACRAATGACWAIVAEKYRLILFGTYPSAEAWRATLAVAVLLAAIAGVGIDRFRHPAAGLASVLAAVAIWAWLMGGGIGLSAIPASLWGGLPLTIGLAVGALIIAPVLALPMALARRSPRPVVATLAWGGIETFRSTPLISLLLAADLLIPLLLPSGWQIDKVWRAFGAITLLASAYLAEVLRGALQAVPDGQRDAAAALGLNRKRAFWLVILPQVCRIGLPAFANVFIGTIKDTSLVVVIGLLDITGAAKAAVAEPQWRAYGPEIYAVVAAIYFALCYPIAFFLTRQEAGTNSRKRSIKAETSASPL